MKPDKELILKRFSTCFEGYNKHADVQRSICARLDELLPEHDVRRGLELGAGTGFLTRYLMNRWPQAEWFVNDLSPEAERFIAPLMPAAKWLWGDAESIPYPSELDIIASASTVQWFTGMTKFVERAMAALTSEGILALSSFGPENFREMKPAGLDYISLNELSSIITNAGLRILHAEEWTETLSFSSPHAVLRYIKTLGLNALSDKSYAKSFNATQLTYHPLIVIAVK